MCPIPLPTEIPTLIEDSANKNRCCNENDCFCHSSCCFPFFRKKSQRHRSTQTDQKVSEASKHSFSSHEHTPRHSHRLNRASQ